MSADSLSLNSTGQNEKTKTDFELLDTLMKAVNTEEFSKILPAAWAIISRYSATACERGSLDGINSGNIQKIASPLPEWGDCKDVKYYFGLSRSVVYRLMNEKKITTASLNEHELKSESKTPQESGPIRGKRLFKLGSVARYLDSLATGGIPDIRTSR